VRLHFIPIVLLPLLASAPAFAGEDVVLSSGLRLHADRHEQSGDLMRLYRGAGVTELPAAMIVGFEPDPPVPTPPVAAAPSNSENKPVAALAAAHPPEAPLPPNPRALVRAAAERNGLPSAFVESVAKVESGFDPRAISPKGALGVMQLMPGTAQILGADPHDLEQNIDAGTKLLRDLLLKYNGDVAKALAAYNAGEGAVDRFQGVPPYSETQHYINSVVRDYLKNSVPVNGGH
jgi:soluble lytic murein transglycosylase-like protein